MKAHVRDIALDQRGSMVSFGEFYFVFSVVIISVLIFVILCICFSCLYT